MSTTTPAAASDTYKGQISNISNTHIKPLPVNSQPNVNITANGKNTMEVHVDPDVIINGFTSVRVSYTYKRTNLTATGVVGIFDDPYNANTAIYNKDVAATDPAYVSDIVNIFIVDETSVVVSGDDLGTDVVRTISNFRTLGMLRFQLNNEGAGTDQFWAFAEVINGKTPTLIDPIQAYPALLSMHTQNGIEDINTLNPDVGTAVWNSTGDLLTRNGTHIAVGAGTTYEDLASGAWPVFTIDKFCAVIVTGFFWPSGVESLILGSATNYWKLGLKSRNYFVSTQGVITTTDLEATYPNGMWGAIGIMLDTVADTVDSVVVNRDGTTHNQLGLSPAIAISSMGVLPATYKIAGRVDQFGGVYMLQFDTDPGDFPAAVAWMAQNQTAGLWQAWQGIS